MNQTKQSKRTRTGVGIQPIYCTHCPDLALAVLTGVPMCRACAFKAATGRDVKWIEKNTKPLEIKGPVGFHPKGSKYKTGFVA